MGLAVGSLLFAGVLALLLVVARTPPFVYWVRDPLFFKRCLVVHVDLALVVWFYAFLAALHQRIPAHAPRRVPAAAGFALSLAGIGALVAAVGIEGVEPVLSNYVPVLDHPLFLCGLAAFGAGVALSFFDGRLLPWREAEGTDLDLPPAARPGLRAAAIAFLLALATFVGGALGTPSGLPALPRYELAMWGGGHVLQFASSAAMVGAWLHLVERASGVAPVGRRLSAVLFALLVAPLLGAPLLTLAGSDATVARDGFTQLMRWGIFPVVSVFLLLCLRALWRGGGARTAAGVGFLTSAGLCVLGYSLGALIREPNTMVPAHYHASIGAVTASFMAVAYLHLEPLGLRLPAGRLGRWAHWQPALFGVGQTVFAVGFGAAGLAGAARKAYGPEQSIRSLQEWIGLTVMGAGGLVAAAGGILFLTIMAAAFWPRLRGALPGRSACRTKLSANTLFSG
ncbi:MAG: hypothetical protein D6731_11140 [Planctomycetota bacterium]|nr:MAG: hypothetical protein D6731_11140 [Planctomycetota bacterium]